METPLTPLEFARRSRKLYPDRVAVIDGDSRWSYAQFLDRCDRWSAALQKLGIGPGDRVAYLSPNTHAQLESFYAVPQIGAVLVPLNYRLTADDFVYLINHSGSRMVCADRDYLATIDSVREHLPKVEHFVALMGEAEGWLNYEAMVDATPAEFAHPEINETDLLTINYTSGTTARPKGVMITHRNAWMNSIGTLLYAPMTCADRYLWTLPMFHANGWTFVWTVTAAGATHICLRKVESRAVFELMRDVTTEHWHYRLAEPVEERQFFRRVLDVFVCTLDRINEKRPRTADKTYQALVFRQHLTRRADCFSLKQ